MGKRFQVVFGVWLWAATSPLFISCRDSSYPAVMNAIDLYDPSNYGYQKPSYNRFNEMKQECRSDLKKASMLHPDPNRVYNIKNELSFDNGDWNQDKGSAPLMPYVSIGDSNFTLPEKHSSINLVSLKIRDVDSDKGSGKMVNVSGHLQLAITSDRGAYFGDSNPESFQVYPGFTLLGIVFEGVYFESGGERLLCMLGSTNLPSRGDNASNPWDWAERSESLSPPLWQDDKILLQLHYPKSFTLATREIKGKLMSLNQPSSSKYFDEINLSSRLGAYSNYEYGSSLLGRACDPYPYSDEFQTKGIQIFKGKEFCSVLSELMTGQLMDIVPNWQCNGTDEYCSKLGPFTKDNEVQATDGSFKNTKLIVQDVRCADPSIVDSDFASVSAVFRAVPPSQSRTLAYERSGLNGLTLSAEGKWSSSSGQLCMVGCLGSINNDASSCNSRICFYIPLSLSIKQRSVAVGSISILQNKSKSSFYPLTFELLLHPPQLPLHVLNRITYTYSKTDLAGAMLEKDEPIGFGVQFKKSFLKYPWKEFGKTRESYSLLSEDLSVHALGILEPFSKGKVFKTFIDLDVIAVDEFVGVDWERTSNFSFLSGNSTQSSRSKGPEEEKYFLKIAALLNLEGNFSKLFIEGLYDPRVGKMYLIGCKDVRAPWKVMHDSGDLEDGLDCLVNVKVEYPPTNARWFINPTVKLSVTSQRTEDDPLYFKQIKVQTLPILYKRQREEIISRKSLEGFLRILTLSLMIGCILSQLFYIKKKTEVVPYISLVMLGLQAIGYSIPLITGAEALFERMKSDSVNNEYSALHEGRWSDITDYMVKLLLLIAFLLTLRLGQKVVKSRIRLLTRSPLEPWRVPTDKHVLAVCSAIHALGFLIVLIVHSVNVSHRPIQSSTYLDWEGNVHKQHEWETELKEYVGLMQDFFLLPQIVGNVFWQVESKQPLRKLYYMGVTVLRLLPHLYDYLKSPVFNPYFADQYEFANPTLDFYSKFGDIAIPVTAVVLAIVVYIQQRWYRVTLKRAWRSSSAKLMRLGSSMYERLPSQTFEAELVSGVNGHVNGHSHENEDESVN